MPLSSSTFALAKAGGQGVVCDETGLFVGGTPLLTRTDAPLGSGHWRSRPLADLNAELGKLYGAPVDAACKLGGLNVVADALDDGDLARAQIAALHLRLPDPPLAKTGARSPDQDAALVHTLRTCDLLAKSLSGGFDPDKHPHWPAGSPESVGGQFMPVSGAGVAGGSVAPTAQQPPADKPNPPKRSPGSRDNQPSPLATSLNRRLQRLSNHDQAFLASIDAKVVDPSNRGIVYFDKRDDALRDMGYFFSADIVRYDDSANQDERGAWLMRDPKTGKWFYDRSQMRVGAGNAVRLPIDSLAVRQAYADGNLINVHIHPRINSWKPGADQDNEANHTFSTPGPGNPYDAGYFAAITAAERKDHPQLPPLHAAVIGSDGSIWYAEGGSSPEAYERHQIVQVARPGTIPLLPAG